MKARIKKPGPYDYLRAGNLGKNKPGYASPGGHQKNIEGLKEKLREIKRKERERGGNGFDFGGGPTNA